MHIQEFQERISGKKVEVIGLYTLADKLKEGTPQPDENYLTQELAELDNTIAVLIKGCTDYQQELEEGLERSDNFNDKLQKTTANMNENKQKLEKFSPANLDIPSVKAKLEELNVIFI